MVLPGLLIILDLSTYSDLVKLRDGGRGEGDVEGGVGVDCLLAGLHHAQLVSHLATGNLERGCRRQTRREEVPTHG